MVNAYLALTRSGPVVIASLTKLEHQIADCVTRVGVGKLSDCTAKFSANARRSDEDELAGLAAIASRHPPTDRQYQQHLVSGNVVVASDYFKSFLASLVNLLGGRVKSFETLLDRGRREALLRLKEQASQQQATAIFNVKYETVRVGGRVTTIEVLAYGTALVPSTD